MVENGASTPRQAILSLVRDERYGTREAVEAIEEAIQVTPGRRLAGAPTPRQAILSYKAASVSAFCTHGARMAIIIIILVLL